MNTPVYNPTSLRAITLAIIAFAWLVPSAPPLGAESQVSYSAEQADRGKKKYKKECQECHGDNLKGGLNGGAPLRGLNFEKKFIGEVPAVALFAYMSAKMPPNSPGRYSPKTYADLMAYVLKRNGFKAGTPLPSDFGALGELIMKK